MKEFIVLKREVNVVAVKVKADNREEAVQKVSDYEGEECSTEYSHTLATDTWSVEEDGKTYYHNESNGKYDKCIGQQEQKTEAETE
jgi:mannitol/fructose-specific phosphotransferase system IIA component (Ntr-type)